MPPFLPFLLLFFAVSGPPAFKQMKPWRYGFGFPTYRY